MEPAAIGPKAMKRHDKHFGRNIGRNELINVNKVLELRRKLPVCSLLPQIIFDSDFSMRNTGELMVREVCVIR